MIFIDVDTAVVVPVNVCPLIDDTDFKTRETAVAYNAAGMDLVWNFVTSAGVVTQTAVTPTTAGVYDWAHAGDAMYTIEIPASGGASINNDTEGYGYFTGICTGVLAWRGPTICFRASGVNDKLCDSAYDTTRGLAGTALPGAAAEAAGGLYTRGTGAGQINQDANGRIDSNVAAMAANVLTAAATAADFGTEIAAAVWNAATSSMTTAGSIGKKLADWTIHSAADVWAVATRVLTAGTNIALAKGTGVTGFNDLSAADVRTAVGLASANLDTQLAALPTAAGNADAVWDEAISGHLSAGSTGLALNSAGSAGDPWSTAVPGAYGAGTAGKILGDNLNATVSSRAIAGDAMALTSGERTTLAAAIWNALTSGMSTVGSIGKKLADWVVGTIDTYTGNTKQTGDSYSVVTHVTYGNSALHDDITNLQTYIDTEIAAILEDTGTTLPAQIAALNNLSASQVNAEVVDVLATDTAAELAAVPAANASLKAKITFLAMLARNKLTQTSTQSKLYADDGTTQVGAATVSDDGTTYTRGELA